MQSGMGLYDLSMTSLRGETVPLRTYAGRPLLIVNTASACGFTPQLGGLQALWERRRGEGLVVIGVPCNDFGGQEPGTAEAIGQFCAVNYGVDFPMMAKVRIRGRDADPVFRWLIQQGGYFSRPRWNFYKFLVDGEGRLRTWFSSLTAPGAPRFERAIDRLLRPAG